MVATLGLAAEELPPVYAELHTDVEHIYERERFTIVLTVYSAGPELGSQLNISALPGGGQLKLGQFEQMVVKGETVGGHRRVRRYRSVAQAARAGRIELRPTLQGTAIVRQRGFFTSIRRSRLSIPVRPLVLEIQPVPDEGRPDDYSGAVGRFSFHVDVEPTELALGDLIHVTMTIRGSGDLSAIPPPTFPGDDDFKVYATRAIDVEDTEAIRFEKTIVPLTSNVNEVAAIQFSYFNPRARSYETIVAGPFALAFHAQRKVEPRSVHRPRPETADQRALELPALKVAPEEWKKSVPDRIGAGSVVLHSLPLLIVALSWASSRRRGASLALLIAFAGVVGIQAIRASDRVEASLDPARTFSDSATAYAGARYADAIQGYESMVSDGYASSAVLYNLGNAYLKAGRAGVGVLHLNRARLRAPRDPEIRASLDAAAGFFELERPVTPAGYFQRLTPGQWRSAAVGAYWIGCIAVAVAVLMRRQRAGGAVAICTIVLVGLCGAGYGSWIHGAGSRAGVAVDSATAYFAPGDRSIVQFKAEPGEILQVLVHHGDWTKIDRRGDRGWVRSNAVRSIGVRD